MDSLFRDISELDFGSTGPSISINDIYEANEILLSQNRPKLPQDVILFLTTYNGLRTENGVIWGIDVKNHTFYDIVAENLVLSNPYPDILLILGEDDTKYIAYNKASQKYALIDNRNYEELFASKSFANLIRQILKIAS